MEKTEYSTFLVDLDCLLDTRFAILTSFGKEAFSKAFDKSYYNRLTDRFTGIPVEDFNNRYQARDKTILKNTMGTPAIQMLAEFAKETLGLIEKSPHHFIPRILINTFPYELTDEEKTTILNSFTQLTNEKAIVEMIHLSKKELTPSFVKNETSIVMMYDYFEWLEIHSENENFKRVTCPSVTLIGPAIYFKGLPNNHDMQVIKDSKVDAFKAMEITASPLINLRLLPIDLFSIAVKLERHKST